MAYMILWGKTDVQVERNQGKTEEKGNLSSGSEFLSGLKKKIRWPE